MLDLLVVASTAPDLRGLHQALGERIEGRIRNLQICGKAVGVGLAAATAGSAKRVFQLQPRAVVLIGTCGVYPGYPDYQPLDVIVANRTLLVDAQVDAGQATFPAPMSTRIDSHEGLTAGLGGSHPRAKTAPIASTVGNLHDDAYAMALQARHGVHAQQLETFGVASTCHLARVPFAAALAITHIVGSHAERDWKRFHRDATMTAAELVLTWIHAGAPGLPHGHPVGG
ncbi:MAG: hypothetical protein AAGE52_18750 [Myxococcota bacterium]